MNIQTKYSIILSCMILIQLFCAYKASKSDKPIKKYIRMLNFAVIVPLLSNLLIVGAHTTDLVSIGCYGYYISMTILMVCLVNFTNEYCQGIGDGSHKYTPGIMYAIGTIDIAQMIFCSTFGEVFSLKKIIIDGKDQYIPVPEIGLAIHRIINYSIYLSVLAIFIIAVKRTPKIYREKFTTILYTLTISGIIQAFNIFHRLDVDVSILCHGVSLVILYYFSIVYRPLRILDAMLSTVASDMDDSVFIFDSNNNCLWANENGYKLLHLEQFDSSKIKFELNNKFKGIFDIVENSKDIYLPESHEYFTIEKKIAKLDSKSENGTFIIAKNATDRRAKIEKEIYDSMHDSLTDLYNQQYLYSNIKIRLTNVTDNEELYIIYMNVKNFKMVNDIFGMEYGDQVLIAISNWLRNNIDNGYSIYGRLVGDTFGILMPKDRFNESLFTDELSKFVVKYKNIEYQVFIHVGIYKITDKTLDISVMFDRAHLAVSNLSDNYKSVIKYYNDDIRLAVLEEQKLVSDLEEAIKNNQIQPYLQPITDVNGNVVGAEALARWVHPENGFMPPYKFIPIFEKNGMIVEVDKHMWRQSCQILNRWKRTNPDLFLSINISPKDFYFTNVVNDIKMLVKEYDIDPVKLRIEITETAMMADSEERLRIFNEFRKLGFIVEMDDFGSGYSSLSMLKNMPVDVLKIDMKFLSSNNKSDTSKAKTIVKNVINMADELNISALTEGVETKHQYDQLINMGCTLFQGYYFAKPMPVDEFEQFVSNRRSAENETI